MTADHSDEVAQRASDLIDDVQRFGLLSAATVVDRYIAMVDGAIADDAKATEVSPLDEVDPLWVVDRSARLVEAYLRFLDTAVLVASRVEGRAVTQDLERIVLPAAPPAGSVEVSLWIHNPTSEPAARINVEVTDLMSAEGVIIPARAVSLSPPRLEALDASTSRELGLRIDVPVDQPTGCYNGLVLMTAAPGNPIVLQVEVEGPRAEEPGEDGS